MRDNLLDGAGIVSRNLGCLSFKPLNGGSDRPLVNNLHLLNKAINPIDKDFLGYEENITPIESILSQENIDLLNNLDSNYFPSKFYKILNLISDLKKFIIYCKLR